MAIAHDTSIVRAPLHETGQEIIVTIRNHALERFIERVRPGLDAVHAGVEVERLAVLGRITATRPSWLSRESSACLYLVLGDVAFVLAPDDATPGQLVALTCLVARGSVRRGRARGKRRRAR